MVEELYADQEKIFWNQLKIEVPKLLHDANTWSIGSVIEKEKAEKLITIIKQWLLGYDYEVVLKNLEKKNNPPTVCGHSFSSGEATYTCVECAIDATCVLCKSCFKRSIHATHEYKMHSSNGGGCCDCGDEEAWKAGASCSFHASNSQQNSVNVLSSIDQEFLKRLKERLGSILSYVAGVLILEKCDEALLPTFLSTSESEDRSATVVYNDESHTYDYVINVLSKCCKCNNKKAADFATIIDREGRTIVKQGPRDVCVNVKTQMMMPNIGGFNMEPRNSSPLSTYVFPLHVVAHQEFAICVFAWLTDITKSCEVIRMVVAKAFLSKDDDEEDNLLRRLMIADSAMWKSARNAYFKLIMSTMMLDMDVKKDLSVDYTRLYSKLMVEFTQDDQDLAVSILSLSVQIFTVPSIALHLAEKEGLLDILLSSVVSIVCNEVDSYEDCDGVRLPPDDRLGLILDKRKLKNTYNRFYNVFIDLKYALTTVPTEWSDDLIFEFCKFFKTFVKLIGCMESMDWVERKTDRHMEHEPEWQSGVTVQMRLVPVIHHIISWCESNGEVLFKCLEHTIKRLHLYHGENDTNVWTVPYAGEVYSVLCWDITRKRVSVHYPLTRLLAALLMCTSRHPFTRDKIMSLFSGGEDQLLYLCDRSIRALALYAQTVGNTWRRNGVALVNQVYYSKEIRCRSESFDRDLQMLQACAGLLNQPDRLFVTLLDRFNILKPGERFEYSHTVMLKEEVVTLVQSVCFERYHQHVGQVDFKQIARHEIVHVLASGDKPHSKIYKILHSSITDNPQWEEVLKEVANFVPATRSSNVARYRLKDECLIEVNPHFYHFPTPNEQSNAFDENLKRRAAAKQSKVFVPQAVPKFHDNWDNTLNILCCSTFMAFMRSIIDKPVTEGPQANASDKLIEKALYLVSSAIVEERERVKSDISDDFRFCQRAEEEKLMDAIRAAVENPNLENQKSVLCWIINSYDDIQQRRLGVEDHQTPTFTSATTDSDRSEAERRLERKKAAAARRDAMMSKMKSQQDKFKAKHSDHLEKIGLEQSKDGGNNSMMELDDESNLPAPAVSSCFDRSLQVTASHITETKDVCILCQDVKDSCLVLAAYCQVSTVLNKDRSSYKPFTNQRWTQVTNGNGVHVSTCSHAMHYSCWSDYFDHSKQQHQFRTQRRLYTRYDVERNEYDCPLCRRLSNCVLPIASFKTVCKMRGVLSDESFPSSATAADSSRAHHKPDTIEFLTNIQLLSGEALFESEMEEDMDDEDDGVVSVGGEEAVQIQSPIVFAVPTPPDLAPDPVFVHPTTVQRPDLSKLTFKQSLKMSFKKLLLCYRAACLRKERSTSVDPQQSCTDTNLLLWRSIAYTIQSLEMVSRYNDKPIMAEAPIRESKTLQGVIRSAFLTYRIERPSEADERNYAKMMGLLLNEQGDDSLLTTDIFSSMISFIFLMDCLSVKKPKSSSKTSAATNPCNSVNNDRNIVQLCAVAKLTQIMLLMDTDEITSTEAICDSNVIRAFNQVRSYADLEPMSNIDDTKLEASINRSFLPFIRCCMLFMGYSSSVEPALSLKLEDDLVLMLQYLELPTTICGLLCLSTDGSTLHPAIQTWCSHVSVSDMLRKVCSKPKLCFYPGLSEVSSLVSLEKEYCDVMIKALNFRCPRFPVEDEQVHPTLCLICGKLLCSQTYCCQQEIDGTTYGPCSSHAIRCSHEHGLFLRVRQCKILLLNRSRGCFRAAPYVDRHGETDIGLKRGNPILLNMSRMKELNLLWLNHQIDEITIREIDNNRHFGNISWLNM